MPFIYTCFLTREAGRRLVIPIGKTFEEHGNKGVMEKRDGLESISDWLSITLPTISVLAKKFCLVKKTSKSYWDELTRQHIWKLSAESR